MVTQRRRPARPLYRCRRRQYRPADHSSERGPFHGRVRGPQSADGGEKSLSHWCWCSSRSSSASSKWVSGRRRPGTGLLTTPCPKSPTRNCRSTRSSYRCTRGQHDRADGAGNERICCIRKYKLRVMLLVETRERDPETRDAIDAGRCRTFIEVVEVPPVKPYGKQRALDYAAHTACFSEVPRGPERPVRCV